MHLFLLKPGKWLGQGTIKLSQVKETLPFYQRWNVSENVNGEITAVQEIEVVGNTESIINHFKFKMGEENKFSLVLNSNIVTNRIAEGFWDPHSLSWEYKNTLEEPDQFHGFESFKKLEEERYTCRAEFISGFNFRTSVEGSMWKAQEEEEKSPSE